VDGRTRPKGELVPDYYPAAVTMAEWDAAQPATRGRRGNTSRPGSEEANLFSGIVWEERGKRKMSVNPVSVGGKRYQYLVSYHDQWEKPIEGGRGCRYEPFEEMMLQTVSELEAEEVLAPGRVSDERSRRMQELTALLTNGRSRLDQIEAALADLTTDGSEVPALQRSAGVIERQMQEMGQELKQLQEEAETSWPSALGEAQSLVEVLREKKGTPEEGAIRLRLKAALRGLLESVWVYVQPVHRTARVIHAQIYFRSGRVKYVRTAAPANPPAGFQILDLRGCDFRKGDVGHVTPNAAGA
jgi:hypothetical protein